MNEKWSKVLATLVLILGAHIGSMAASIRYGFLAVSFEKRDIQAFGLIEGTIVFGYVAGFFFRKFSERMTEKMSPRWMIVCTVTILSLTCAMSGLADFASNNTIFAVISIAARVTFGFFEFPKNVASMDILKTLFPDNFDFLNGLMQMGYCSGHGVGEYVGVILYEHFGYKIPFLCTTTLLLLILTLSALNLPSCPSITLSDPEPKKISDDPFDELSNTETTSLTPYVWFPMGACMLINCVYAYLQISTTPYLLDRFSVPLSVGGTVLICLSAGISLGSFLSGAITQSRFCNAYTQMAIGAGVIGLGLLLMFPSPSIAFLYTNVPHLAYSAVLLCGMGDPIITVPTLRAITDLQIMIKGKCTGKNTLSLFSMWIMASSCAMYAGTIVGGTMMEYLSYIQCSYVFLAFCCTSIVISVGVNMAVKHYQKYDVERIPILKKRCESYA